MILGSLNMASCHYQYPEAIQKALHWLKNNDLAAMEAGPMKSRARISMPWFRK